MCLLRLIQLGCRSSASTAGGKPTPRRWPATSRVSDTPIWLPQIDWAGAAEGFVESEFPLYPFLVSRVYQLFGIHEWLGR